MLLFIDQNKVVPSYISTGCDTKCTDLSQPPPVFLSIAELYFLVVVFCLISLFKWTIGH